MQSLLLTTEVLNIISANALSATFRPNATPVPNGLWSVPVDDDVMRFIEERRFVGETDAQVVLRLLTIRKVN